ncbi:hypothetical protein PVAP13_5NG285681 [Panicum virgatum]|uniref:Uncharacterized protein n=1 Tax=Panicum virgatum TaxID=38727 RepID=A0A8T0RWU9_PANVG|nr:hypothetical protein PVAP13_5NG285681 [Panicum virgatum]
MVLLSLPSRIPSGYPAAVHRRARWRAAGASKEGRKELLGRLPCSQEELAAALHGFACRRGCALPKYARRRRRGSCGSGANFGSTRRLEKDGAVARRDEGARAELDPLGASRAAGEDTPPPPWTRARRDLLGADPPMCVPPGPICLGPCSTGGPCVPRFCWSLGRLPRGRTASPERSCSS